MGSSSSRPARKLVKDVASSTTPLKSTGAGATSASRPAQAHQNANFAASQAKEIQGIQGRYDDPLITTGLRGAEASETKSKAVMEDGRDPQLMANLQKLGQVQVPRGKVNFQPQNQMLSILSARERDSQLETKNEANEDAILTTRNRMAISTIVAMLDARKECKSNADLEQVAKGFDVDVEVLRNLAIFVNSPSVDSSSDHIKQHNQSIRVEDGDDALQLIEAVWTEPAIEESKRIQA